VLLEKFLGNSKVESIELIAKQIGAYESAAKILFKHQSYSSTPWLKTIK